MNTRSDLYARVTSRIVEALEQGVRPWVKPWTVQQSAQVTLPLRHNGTPYRGINVLLLWSEAIEKGYSSARWLTFKQAAQLNGCVRKGEHGSMVVYTDRFMRTSLDDAGEEVEEQIPFLKSYTVFNAEQIEGLPEEFYAPPAARKKLIERIARAEVFFSPTNAYTIHGGDQACYIPMLDRIHIPNIEFFRDAESYYATRGHETVHSTMHPSRLNRSFGSKRWGDEGYAVEELVAELGAAFLCAELDLANEPRVDHASYLTSWLKVLNQDKRAIFTAASHAQRAVDYLMSLQLQPQPPGEAAPTRPLSLQGSIAPDQEEQDRRSGGLELSAPSRNRTARQSHRLDMRTFPPQGPIQAAARLAGLASAGTEVLCASLAQEETAVGGRAFVPRIRNSSGSPSGAGGNGVTERC